MQQRIALLRNLIERFRDDPDIPNWARDACKWTIEDDDKQEQEDAERMRLDYPADTNVF